MKLVGFSILATLLLAVPAARADEVLQPPGGPVYVVADPPVQKVNAPGANAPGQRDPQRVAQRRAQMQALRAAMLQAFDKNGDGKLGPRERAHAVRVLQKIERRLAGGGLGVARNGQGKRQGGQMRRFIQRYDMNGDGQVGPGEMPPAAANKLRRLDRNRDGWVEPNEAEQR